MLRLEFPSRVAGRGPGPGGAVLDEALKHLNRGARPERRQGDGACVWSGGNTFTVSARGFNPQSNY